MSHVEQLEKLHAGWEKNGGPVHPVTYNMGPNAECTISGISLRDHLAAKIIAALTAAGSVKSWAEDAKTAYDGADAMLAERAKRLT
jgi:hypothetical protein